ncbi:MAG: peptidoglycan-binding domain-containing protein [Spirochaetales bacterium]|nr:peptidoglycan-binding domain-containing protein [Spirochaetales bacterium]
MKKRIIVPLLLLLLSLSALTAQNLSPEEELYLADPDPRYNGEQVKDLQRFLLFKGMDIGSDGIDGWFGKDTHNALLNYQFNNGQEETGRIKIKDIPKPLSWSPFVQTFLFSGWPEGPMPGNEHDGETVKAEAGKDLTYSSYFGSITIPADEIQSEGYKSFILSPAKRFLAAFNGDRSSVILWDILSGTKLEYPIEETAKDSSYQYEPENHTDFEGESISWWMDPMKYDRAQLTFVVYYTFQGPQQKDRSLITVSPYIQF